MGPTSMVHAGEAGLTTVVEGMAKMREALPDSIREAADRRLGADSTLGKGVLAMVDTVAEESAQGQGGEGRDRRGGSSSHGGRRSGRRGERAGTGRVDGGGSQGVTRAGGQAPARWASRSPQLPVARTSCGSAASRRPRTTSRARRSGASAGGGTVSDLSGKVSAAASAPGRGRRDVADEVDDSGRRDARTRSSDRDRGAADEAAPGTSPTHRSRRSRCVPVSPMSRARMRDETFSQRDRRGRRLDGHGVSWTPSRPPRVRASAPDRWVGVRAGSARYGTMDPRVARPRIHG